MCMNTVENGAPQLRRVSCHRHRSTAKHRKHRRQQALFGLNFICNSAAIFHFSAAARFGQHWKRRKICCVLFRSAMHLAEEMQSDKIVGARGKNQSRTHTNTHSQKHDRWTSIGLLLGEREREWDKPTHERKKQRNSIQYVAKHAATAVALKRWDDDTNKKKNKTEKSMCVLGAIKVEQIAFTVTHSCFFFHLLSFRSPRPLMRLMHAYLFSVDWRRTKNWLLLLHSTLCCMAGVRCVPIVMACARAKCALKMHNANSAFKWQRIIRITLDLCAPFVIDENVRARDIFHAKMERRLSPKNWCHCRFCPAWSSTVANREEFSGRSMENA